jgi:hypothetical protein
VLQPSQVANFAGDSTMHAMKGGQKLIGKLYETKNKVYMYTMPLRLFVGTFLTHFASPTGVNGFKQSSHLVWWRRYPWKVILFKFSIFFVF